MVLHDAIEEPLVVIDLTRVILLLLWKVKGDHFWGEIFIFHARGACNPHVRTQQ